MRVGRVWQLEHTTILLLLERRQIRASGGREAVSLFLGGALIERGGIGRYCSPDELLEGSLFYLLPFMEIDRAPQVAFQAGIKELARIFDGRASKEREFDGLLVRLSGADSAIMGPDGNSRGFWLFPFPLLLNLGVGIEDELTEAGERLASPISQVLDALGYFVRGGRIIWTTCGFHVLSLSGLRS